jgi:hypothetical protein
MPPDIDPMRNEERTTSGRVRSSCNTTIEAMEDARLVRITKAASLDALFVDLNADT